MAAWLEAYGVAYGDSVQVAIGRATVTEKGIIKDLEVICDVRDKEHRDAFRRFVSALQFEPALKNGRPTDYSNFFFIADYTLGKFDPKTCEPIAPPLLPGETPTVRNELDADMVGFVRHVQPVYPEAAIEADQEGKVVLQFTISRSGKVLNPVVVCSTPKGVFDSAALTAVRKWKYRSLAEERPACLEIEFNLEDPDETEEP
jgi:TonB family protein